MSFMVHWHWAFGLGKYPRIYIFHSLKDEALSQLFGEIQTSKDLLLLCNLFAGCSSKRVDQILLFELH